MDPRPPTTPGMHTTDDDEEVVTPPDWDAYDTVLQDFVTGPVR